MVSAVKSSDSSSVSKFTKKRSLSVTFATNNDWLAPAAEHVALVCWPESWSKQGKQLPCQSPLSPQHGGVFGSN